MKLAVFGLGKLGAPLAAVFAHKGHQVVGVDVNPGAVDAINRGETPVDEPQLAELIAQNRERLSATDDAAGAARDCEASLIIVPTPSRADGSFSSDLGTGQK